MNDARDRISKVIEPLQARDDSQTGLYFVGAAGANLVKIGWVQRLDKIEMRLQRMQTDCPYPVMLLFTIGPASRLHEKRAHTRFMAQHWHGEWFKNEGDLAVFLRLAASDVVMAADDLRKTIDLTF